VYLKINNNPLILFYPIKMNSNFKIKLISTLCISIFLLKAQEKGKTDIVRETFYP